MAHPIKKYPSTPQWKSRTIIVGFGAMLVATGLAAIHEGYWWIFRDNTWAGTGYAQSLDFVFLGGAIIILGLIPWKPIRRLLDRWPDPNRRV